MTAEVSGVLASVAEAERLRIVATLIRITGDWELSEDCFQDAVARALTSWPKRGIPDNPAAWLTTVSKNLVVDAYRRASTEQKTAAQLARESEIDAATSGGDDMDALTADDALDDDRLRLIFTCCHPALAMESRVALTLRTVMGCSGKSWLNLAPLSPSATRSPLAWATASSAFTSARVLVTTVAWG